jgi:hypothetical protein
MKITGTLLATALLAVLALGATSGRTSAEPGVPSLVWWLDNPAEESGLAVDGAFSTLQRGYYSVTIGLHTRGLTPGHTYSVWWVIFQNPGLCVNGCGDDDINNAAWTGANPVGIGVHYGGAFTAAEDGRAEVGSRLLEDTTDQCARAGPYAPLCVPMKDAATAEALVFLLDHGPADPATVRYFDSGCRSLVWFGQIVSSYNHDGFDCYRAQSTFHRP